MDIDKIIRLTQELIDACEGNVAVTVPFRIETFSPYIQIFAAMTPPPSPVYRGMTSEDNADHWSGLKRYEKKIDGIRIMAYLTEEEAALAGL